MKLETTRTIRPPQSDDRVPWATKVTIIVEGPGGIQQSYGLNPDLNTSAEVTQRVFDSLVATMLTHDELRP